MNEQRDSPLEEPLNEFVEGRLRRALDRVDKGLEALLYYLLGVSKYLEWAKKAPEQLLKDMRVPQEALETSSEEIVRLSDLIRKVSSARDAIKELQSEETFVLLKLVESNPELIKA